MTSPYFFGYGSLVNSATHSHEGVEPATLTGWSRAWRRTRFRDISFLTAVPDSHASIAGIVAPVPNSDWAALDAREFAYYRAEVSRHVQVHGNPTWGQHVSVYAISEQDQEVGTEQTPILLSYLDVVVQGYHKVFGEQGVWDFVETTKGWDTPILNDRAAPLYPRAQTLSAFEVHLSDAVVSHTNARLII